MENIIKKELKFSDLGGKTFQFITEWKTQAGTIPQGSTLYVNPIGGNNILFNGGPILTGQIGLFQDLLVKEANTPKLLREVQPIKNKV